MILQHLDVARHLRVDLDAEQFLLPSIFTLTMPPPAEASTRICAISCCHLLLHLLRLLHHGLHVSGQLHSSTFQTNSLLLQIANRAHFAAENLAETLHFRIGQRPLCGIVRCLAPWRGSRLGRRHFAEPLS